MIVWDPPFYQLNSITAMGNDNTITGTFNGTVHLEYLPCINYAMIHNHVPSCNFCELMNSAQPSPPKIQQLFLLRKSLPAMMRW